MNYRDERDMRVIDEVITRDTYRLASITESPKYIYDIGAHIGTFATHAHEKFPSAHIVCVEPVDDNFTLLKSNAWFAELHHAAIYYKDNPVHHHTEWQTGSDVIGEYSEPYKNEHGENYWPTEQKVNVLTLSDIIQGEGLLKLDCEFGEYDILEEIITKRLGGNFTHVCGEYHLHFGDSSALIRELLNEAFPHLNMRVRDGGLNNLFFSY